MATARPNETTPLLNSNDSSVPKGAERKNLPKKEWPAAPLVLAVVSVWIASFLSALDTTLTATLSGTIASEFSSLSLISWLGTGYLISNAAIQPLSGKLTDIFSRKTGMLFASVFFGLGNLMCAIAREEWQMILGRVLAGIGGGAYNSICTFVCTDLIPMRVRGLWYGYGMIILGVGLSLGSVFGGLVNEAIGWRWAFILMLPFTVITAIGSAVWIPDNRSPQDAKPSLHRIDFAGAFCLVSALTCLQVGLAAISDTTSTDSTKIYPIVILCAAGLSMFVFILVEWRFALEPIIPLSLLRQRNVITTSLASLFNSMFYVSLVFYVPIYFRLEGHSTGRIGVELLPQSIGAAFGSLLLGAFVRRSGRYYYAILAVLAMCTLGAAGLSAATPHATPYWPLALALAALGLGYGGSLTSLLLALLSATEFRAQAIATSINYAFRSSGATIGVSCASLLFRAVAEASLPPSADLDRVPRCGADGEECGEEVLRGYAMGLRAVFLFTLGLEILAVLCGTFVKEHRIPVKEVVATDGERDRDREA